MIVTNAALKSQLNDLKSQHTADEVKKIDDKTKKNSTDILGFESRLKQKEDTLNDLEREASFNRVNYYCNQQSYFLFESKSKSFNRSGGSISSWISTGIHNGSKSTDLFSVDNSNNNKPTLLNQNNRLGVTFSGNYMKQSKIGYAHGSVVNIYIAYKLKSRRISNSDFTVQNALFGAVKITKDVDTSNYKYSGYGICFDGKSDFTYGNIINGKNVIISGCDMSFSSHANNKVNNIYVLRKDFARE